MYCPHCGKEIADGSYICPHCNQTVETPQQAQPQQQQQNQYNPQYQQYQQPQYNIPNQPVSGKNVCAIIGLVLACVAALFIVIFDILLYGVGYYVGFLFVFSDILVWPALILSIVGMVQVKKAGQKGIAIAALSISISAIVLGFLLNLILVSLIFAFI